MDISFLFTLIALLQQCPLLLFVKYNNTVACSPSETDIATVVISFLFTLNALLQQCPPTYEYNYKGHAVQLSTV